MAAIGRFTPNGWAITAFKAFVSGSAHTKDLLIGACWIAGVGSILFRVIVRRLRKLI
jgi:hypothetical protein